MTTMGRRKMVASWSMALAAGMALGIAISAALPGGAGVGPARDAGQSVAPTVPGALRSPAPDRAAASAAIAVPDFRDVVKSVIPSVVTVRSQRTVEVSRVPFFFMDPFEEFFGPRPRRRQPGPDRFIQRGLGSGVVVDDRGHILTNNHVVQDSTKVEVVLADGKVVPATVKGADPQSDLAVLHVGAAGLRAIPMGRSSELQVGEWVLAVGNPLAEALAHTVTAGIVSAKGRSNLNLADYEDFIQTDAAINPGNSGGALVNARGELVGINTAILTASGGYQGIGFAIPVDMAREIMEKLIRTGKVVRGYIGVTIQDLTPDMARAAGINAERGAIIASVSPGGPAEEAGLRQGDAILAIDGQTVRDKDDLRNRVAATAPGTAVKLTIEREGLRRDVSVRLGELPASARASEGGRGDGGEEGGLGLSVRGLTPRLAEELGFEGERGVVVWEVEPGSAADEAGLRRGDLVKEVNRRPVSSVAEFREALSRRRGADVFLLLVRRGDDTFYVTVRNP